MTRDTQTQVRRLQRPTTQRVIAGVAAGIADYLSISTAAVRIGFIALTIVGGAGIPLYALGWLLIPSAGETSAPAARFLSEMDSRGKQTAAIVIGFLLLAIVVGFPPITLIMAGALGVVSYRLLEN